MSIHTRLRATTPTDLAPVDHDRLQRVGRRRRWASRLASGTAVVAVVAGAGFGLAQLTATDDAPSLLGSTGAGRPASDVPAPEAPSPAPTTDEDRDVTDEVGTDEPAADPAVVDDFADLTHDEAIALLEERLSATPERPDDLVSITVYEAGDGDDVVEELRGDETWDQFPVIAVNHPDFDPTSGFETPAVQPTWDQRTAQLALAALAEHRVFAGVTVDALGRTVVVFGSATSEQFVHVDPVSAYTSGILFGAEEWGAGEAEYHRTDPADQDGYHRETDPDAP